MELYRQQLAQERDRLSRLLNLTNRITSDLDLHDLLRAISATLRQVMECDGGVVTVLPGEEGGQPWVYALDFPESNGFVSEELLVSRGLGGLAFETLKPVIANRPDRLDHPSSALLRRGISVHRPLANPCVASAAFRWSVEDAPLVSWRASARWT